MNLIIIYGPPASGKFTIGTELSKRTGYRLFHNHLTVPVAKTIFPQGNLSSSNGRYGELLELLRLSVIKAAVAEQVDIIFTLAYSGQSNDKFIDQVVKAARTNGGQVHFVQLDAPDMVLLERVGQPSRKKLGKITKASKLREVLSTRNMRCSVNYPNVLHINTAEVTPEKAAEIISQGLLPFVKMNS